MAGAVLGTATIRSDRVFEFRPYSVKFLPWLRIGFGRAHGFDIPISKIESVEGLPPSRYPALRPMPGILVRVVGGGSILLRSDRADDLLSGFPRRDDALKATQGRE